MQYLTSDIHGNFKALKRLLKKIAFDPTKDKLTILGDILDRGSEGIEILNFLKPYLAQGSVELLLGNHEMFCIMYLEGRMTASRWSAFGGDATLKAVNKMSDEEKEELLQFLKSLPIYLKSHSEYLGDFICVHSGLSAFYLIKNADGTIHVQASIEEAYNKKMYEFMCGMDLHYLARADKELLDTYLVVGHVPCNTLRYDVSDRHFLRTPYYMDIDAGCGFTGGKLGCYCVDTDEEVYV